MIRNFVYVDSNKLRSHSSQIFEGVTEHVSRSLRSAKEEGEEQKGPVGSGRVISDILLNESSSTEYRFLEDHAYTIFEKKLIEDGMVIDAATSSEQIGPGKFIRVQSRLQLNDSAELIRLLENFNDFGESISRVVNQADWDAKNIGKPFTDAEVRKIAKANDMRMDEKYIASLVKVLKLYNDDELEALMITKGLIFSAPLSREYLRENLSTLIRKYSRFSQSTFTMLGVAIQIGTNELPEEEKRDVENAENLRDAIRTMAMHQKTLEDAFLGQTVKDILIDPIAIYSEISE